MFILSTTVILDCLFLAIITGISFHAIMRLLSVQLNGFVIIVLLASIFALIEIAYIPACLEMNLSVHIGNESIAKSLGISQFIDAVDIMSFGIFEFFICIIQALIGMKAGKFVLSKQPLIQTPV